MRVLIVDDEPLARRVLQRFLAADESVSRIQECATGEQARAIMEERDTDIVFLDIHMPVMDGFTAIEGLDEEDAPVIVFVTAYEQYALKAIEAGATDYLLKPFDEKRFKKAFERAKKRLREAALRRKGDELAALLTGMAEAPATERSAQISVHDGTRVRLVDIEELLWVEASDKYVMLHTDSGTVKARKTLGEIESQLDPRHFLRVHRSCIVALKRIASLGMTEGGTAYLEMKDGSRVAVSRSRLATVRARLR